MKLKIGILTTVIAAMTSLSALGQGVIFSGAANAVWNDYNNAPGIGVRSNNMVVAFLWNTSGATDPLTSVGNNFATNQAAANKQTATNGLFSTDAAGSIASLFANGWRFATNAASPGSIASATTTATSSFSYLAGANFSVLGQSNGTTYSFIVVAWNLSAGLTALADGNFAAITGFGYSNPFLYATAADSTSSPLVFTASGMNRFGVMPVPEPTTFALAGLGIAGLLAFRRRK